MALQSKNKLQWQCRRGMLELELLLKDFLESRYDELTEQQKYCFEDLLTVIDPVLFDYLMGSQVAEDPNYQEIIRIIRTSRLQKFHL